MMTFEQFQDFYHKHGKCPNDIQARTKPMSEVQLRRRFDRYLESERKRYRRNMKQKPKTRTIKTDEKWELVREEAMERDDYSCQLCAQLSLEEYDALIDRVGLGMVHTIDPAHIFGKGSHPHLRYDVDNLVTLNRWSHTCLDSQKHPITGKMIDADEKRAWWILIIGEERFQRLVERASNPQQYRRIR